MDSAVQGRERVRTLYQSKDPNPHTTNPGKEEKYKTVGDKKKLRKFLYSKSNASFLLSDLYLVSLDFFYIMYNPVIVIGTNYFV